ncbi:MAG TPA: glycosyltransferase family 39 protein [Coleofasciculaceae cyanobacterium]
MTQLKKLSLHRFLLIGVIILGAILRFWQLDLKPLWLDEVLTALFSLGRSYDELPLDGVFPISTLQEILTLKSEVSCPEIAHHLATQSTHPPLFFCLMHEWLRLIGTQPLAWTLRSLPVLFGISAIAAVYVLNRAIFSPSAGLMGALLMAVSPFGVYLSQEARHYTLPMLLIILALLGLIRIQEHLFHKKQLPPLITLIGWVIVNSIGLYIHYFFLLALIAQLVPLIGLAYRQHRLLPRGSIITISLALGAIGLSYLPWLPILLKHMGSSDADWLPPPHNIAPLYQTLSSWLTMVIILPIEAILPVEGSPTLLQILGVVVLSALMIGFSAWVAWQGFRGVKQLWRSPSTHLATFTLLSFIICILLQFFGVVYLLGKDITLVFRYNFVYYPALLALLGASLVQRDQQSTVGSYQSQSGRSKKLLSFWNKWRSHLHTSPWQTALIISLVGLLSSTFVVSDLAFQKSFNPQKIAQDMNLNPKLPRMVVVSYQSSQDVGLGLSFALALGKLQTREKNVSISTNLLQEASETNFAFLNRSTGYDVVWQNLSKLPSLSVPRWNLWVVAPGLKRRDYPQQLIVGVQTKCKIDPNYYHRLGFPYQLYRCFD